MFFSDSFYVVTTYSSVTHLKLLSSNSNQEKINEHNITKIIRYPKEAFLTYKMIQIGLIAPINTIFVFVCYIAEIYFLRRLTWALYMT